MLQIQLTGEGSLSASRPRMAAPGQAADGKPDSGSIRGEADEGNRSLRETRHSQLVWKRKTEFKGVLNLESELSLARTEREC